MKFSSIVTIATAFASSVTASPVHKRQSGSLSANDIAVTQLALYLEHLEFNLYSGGYANYTEAQYEAAGLAAPFRSNINVTAQQEGTHAATLTAALVANGVTPVPPCTYKFPTITSPQTFVATADLITTTGIGAYLGGADLIMDKPAFLTLVGSILTAEARHDAYLRAGLKQSPFPKPFDTPLTATWAYNLAQAFIVECPMQLPIPILPTLSIAPAQAPAGIVDPLPQNGTVGVVWSGTSVPVTANEPLYVALISGPTQPPTYVPLTSTGTNAGSFVLPSGLMGTFFAVLTSFSGGLNTTVLTTTGTLAGPVVFAVNSNANGTVAA